MTQRRAVVRSTWMAGRQGPSGFDLAAAGHRLATRMPRGHGRLAELVVRLALVRGDEPAAVLAHAGRTVALLTGLVRKFA